MKIVVFVAQWICFCSVAVSSIESFEFCFVECVDHASLPCLETIFGLGEFFARSLGACGKLGCFSVLQVLVHLTILSYENDQFPRRIQIVLLRLSSSACCKLSYF